MELPSPTERQPGIAELTLLAPIRRGIVSGTDGLSYLARLKQLLGVLKTAACLAGGDAPVIEASANPAGPGVPGAVLDLTIFEPEHKIRLALGFDPPPRDWLPALSGDQGALLDLILCNCKGYVATSEAGPDRNARWLQTAQAEAQFFSHTVSALVDSEPARCELERLQRVEPESHGGPLQLRLVLPQRGIDARRTVESHPLETVQAGLQRLAVLHRLVELYPAHSADGAVLLRATQALLRELRRDALRPLYAPGTAAYQRFAAPLRWFETAPRVA
jgi:hypothetical protein